MTCFKIFQGQGLSTAASDSHLVNYKSSIQNKFKSLQAALSFKLCLAQKAWAAKIRVRTMKAQCDPWILDHPPFFSSRFPLQVSQRRPSSFWGPGDRETQPWRGTRYPTSTNFKSINHGCESKVILYTLRWIQHKEVLPRFWNLWLCADFLNFYSQDEGEHFPTAGHQRRASAQFPHPKRVLHVEKF